MKKEMRDIVPKNQMKSIRNIHLPEKDKKTKKQEEKLVVIENAEIPIRKIDEPIKEEPLREKKESKNRNRAIWILAVLTIAILFFVISSVFGKATIIVNPKIVSFNAPQNITAKKTPQANEIGYSDVTLSLSNSFFAKGSSQKQISTKAAGKIIIYNNTVLPQKLVSGTRLTTSDGLIFTLDSTVVVPGRSIKGGTTTPGSTAGSITASEAGDKYNIGLTDLNILAFKDSSKYDQIYARSKNALGGGQIGLIAVVDQSFIDTSTQNLEQKIAKDLINKISKQLPEKFVIPDGAYTITFGTSTPVVNKDGATINITGTIDAFAIDAKSLLNYVALNKGQKNTLGTDNVKIINSDLKSLSFNKIQDDLSMQLSGSLTLETAVNSSDIFKVVSGLNRKAAIDAINNISGIDSASVSLSPFWKINVPTDSSKVNITIK